MVVTSDFEEVENLCSRAFVFVRGVPRAELRGGDVTVANMAASVAGETVADMKTVKIGVSA